MAIFNPAVKDTQDPNFLNYSRVLDAPTPDLSGKIGLETAAVGLDSAVNITDTAIKKGISDAAYAAVDPLRDKMTAGLEQIKADLDKGVIPKPAQTVAGTTNPLDAMAMAMPEDNLPVGLQDGLDGVAALAAAKAAGSPKLNDTKYAGDVLSEAKRLRAQYGPGYREYIDQKISEASGLPVANSYYNNMLIDINRQLVQMGKAKDDVYDSLKKSNDMPGQADLMLKYRANPGDPKLQVEVLRRVNDWENLKAQGGIDAAERARTDWNNKDLITKQTESMSRNLNTTVAIHMSALKDAALPGGGTGKDLTEFLNDYALGKHPDIPEAQFNQRRLQYNAWVASVEKAVTAQAAQYAPVIGDVASYVKNAMAPIYAQQKFFNSKEDGPGWAVTRQVEHMKADATNNFLINKDYGKEAAQMLAARAILGEQYFPDWIRSMTAEGVVDKFKGIVSQETLAAIKPYEDDRGNPIPRYHIDAIKHGKQIGATGDDNYFNEKGVTKVIGEIANPKLNLAARDKLIDYAFNKKNVGRLDELKMDYRDPTTGEMVPGKYRMFNLLTSPAITQGVKETSIVHPENYQKYRSTVETEFGRLFRSTLLDLNKAVSPDKAYLGIHFAYNDATNQFSLVDKKNNPLPDMTRLAGVSVQYPDAGYVAGLQDKLSLVNGGLSNLANMHRNDPTNTFNKNAPDTSTYLLQAMQTAGFRPGTNITNATEGMYKAVIKSKNPDMDSEALNKALLGSRGSAARSNFTAEEDNSLAAFLRSPAGRRGENLEPYQTRGVIRGNLSDQPMLGIQTDTIPAGVDPLAYARQLRGK